MEKQIMREKHRSTALWSQDTQEVDCDCGGDNSTTYLLHLDTTTFTSQVIRTHLIIVDCLPVLPALGKCFRPDQYQQQN
jgi:hypothetical protein